jgi:single-stranded DNA-binding protein
MAEVAGVGVQGGNVGDRLGRLQQRTWTAEDGSARHAVEVVAEELGPSLRWATATPVKASRGAAEGESVDDGDAKPRSVKGLVQPEEDSLDAIATDAFDAERAGHCRILGSCVGSAYMGGQP